MKTFAELRAEYLHSAFGEHEAADHPLDQFTDWFEDAVREGLHLANACALATATATGVPSNRVVLLKAFDAAGFVFFTNYESRKGRELEQNPRAELLFWWPALERQIRVGGAVARVSESESDEYFSERPRGSNLSAMASKQSEIVSGRAQLEAEVSELISRSASRELERPRHWGGYRLAPSVFEFWQGREDRLHDRISYRLDGPSWLRDRLYP